MSDNPKKLAVFQVLSKHPLPVSLPELLERLPPDFAERSVRRWLAELVDQGTVEKRGKKRGTRYHVRAHEQEERQVRQEAATPYPPRAERTDWSVAEESITSVFGKDSLAAVARVRQPLFKRKPVSYNQKWVDSYQPNLSSYFTAAQHRELAQRGQRSADQEPAGTYARRIYNRLLIDLSYNSSRLEGNTYSLIDTERLLVEGASAEGKLDAEKVMILNHKEAIRHLVDRAARLPINYDEVCTLHYLLSDGLVPVQYSGTVRDHGVRVGASAYIPLEGKSRLERQLHSVMTKASAIENPHEQSLFLLVHLAYLQAFADVNKRTARLSANIPLLKHNLVPLSFNSIEKDDYASAMIVIYELNDVRPLIDLYRASYLRTCEEYDATAEAVGLDEVRVRYRPERRKVVGQIIARQLIGEALSEYVASQAARLIPDAHQGNFIEDVQEDLTELSPQRIVGLAISQQQLQQWLSKRTAYHQNGSN